jgi:MoxR-like ATPase
MASINVNKNDKVSGIDVLGIEDSKRALEYSVLADQPINLIGPPGIGKSAIVADVASKLKLTFQPLILSLCDPTDIGGFPVSFGGKVDRCPLGPIKRACDEACLLFLDELTCASPAVQGAALRLVYERWAGDQKLHPGTRVIAAANPPEQASGGWELSLPLLGRMTQIKMRPLHSEVQEFFFNLGAAGSSIRNMAVDFAATIEMAPELLAIDPPPGSSTSGRAWGAPRSWERAVRVCAAALDRGEQDSSAVFGACLSGNVGDDAAAAYMTIRKIRHSLPSIKEVLKDPVAAKLPKDVNAAIAVLGILAQVCQVDPCPAWIYADRLHDEARTAATSLLGRYGMQKFTSSVHHKEGELAQRRLLRSIGKAILSQ